ncbi:MAG: molybdopterin converting factor subunit 1 [Alphaproteobacteria bacterium]|nr:molybdopterin converting factor subunit 1 [Alphaproteobacteria bacterium]MDE2013700.1 molybdopterin converting factor subunit 1 [Alphaproteobacteria bacterium]MDE2073250.1 molybdopterin converting factor subunit 1 [Alphaproteobacteria bacterium]MDE2352691.1 molybdopterin converting factor subunit 1 [Alphaproteobacteria bacterium]
MTLVYFAWVRQKVGAGEERIALPAEVTTVAELAAFLRAKGGGYAEAFADDKRLRVAINQEHAGWDAPVTDADEIAFFPPVTGG